MLDLGWRVAAVRAGDADAHSGVIKTQRSLDAKDARIRAGEIRLAALETRRCSCSVVVRYFFVRGHVIKCGLSCFCWTTVLHVEIEI